jgi:hypothetical protein
MLPANKTSELKLLKESSQTKPVATIELAIKAQSQSLSGLKKQSKEETLIIVMLMLEMLLQFFAVTNTMNGAQLEETAKLIINEFYWLKLEDLELFFRRLKTGFYGDLFNRIDGLVIMAKLREYCAEREAAAEKIALVAHKEVDTAIADKVLIKTKHGFIRRDGDEFIEVDNRILATEYDYALALKIVAKMEVPEGEQLKIIPANKAGSLFDYFESVGKTDLIPQSERFKRATDGYYKQKAEIENSDLSDFDKHNAIRALANLEPVTEIEYEQHLKSLIKP